ncbi:acyl-CoA dehydrogenase family protein [Streptomyces yangpuensis]|uniref:acyl-CoA dehydrogenase family protein n=1 Tax=Streptomyces yangpuensis TaxID=1648182 RepID=UPI0036615F42
MAVEESRSRSEWQRTFRTFADEVMAPHVRRCDEERAFPTAIHEKAAAEGILNAAFPEELGGAGLSYTEFGQVIGELSAVCPGMTWTLVFNRGALHPVVAAGTPEQKELFVTRLLKDNGYAALGRTEPDKRAHPLAAPPPAVRAGAGLVQKGCVL